MNRRDFFKMMVATPLFTPLLLASKTTKRDLELYLIADDPHLYLPLLFKELQKYATSWGRNFTFLNSHSQQDGLKRIFSRAGWEYVLKPVEADLTLSFSHLRHKTRPSFTLVKDGRILDLRSAKLYTLWKEMNENHSPSSYLAIASFKNRESEILAGESVSIYKDGRKIETIALKRNVSRSFRTKRGQITARIKDGKAWIVESSCRHKICISSPPVSLAGERIICAPNHLLLEIQGTHSVDTVIG